MKSKILSTVLFACCLFSPIILEAQWESLGDSIIPSEHRARSIKMAKDKSIWIISTSNEYTLTNHEPQVHRSADGGKTWVHSIVGKENSLIGWDISPVDSLTAFIALHFAGLYKTIDGGRSWSKVASYPYHCNLVHFFNSNEGWVFSGLPPFSSSPTDSLVSILHSVTKDGGETWTHIGGENWKYIKEENWIRIGGENWDQPVGTSLPKKLPAEFIGTWLASNASYDYTDESIILGMAQGTIWISNDKGYNWKRIDTPLSKLDLVTTNVTIKDAKTFMIASNIPKRNFGIHSWPGGSESVSFTTRDGGDTWIQGNPGISPTTLQYIPESDGTFVIAGPNALIGTLKTFGSQGTAITYDFGMNWDIIDNNRLVTLDFIDKTNGVATCCSSNNWANANGTVFKWTLPMPGSPLKKSLWYLGFGLIVLCIAGYYLYKFWMGKRLNNIELKEKISKLEESATQAKINPHFIFNCLNAVKSLINRNDKELANKYLVHFAQLTRGLLRVSSEEKIPLEDDIALLESYLELEKMRFSKHFNYKVTIDENVDTYSTMVPGMLVQPIVENSIIHGLANLSEKRKISITYQLKNGHLEILVEATIKDVYQDTIKHKLYKGQWLKSVGIGNTQKRLDLLPRHTEMKVEEKRSENGRVTGTKALLKVILS